VTPEQAQLCDDFIASVRDGSWPIDRLLEHIGRGGIMAPRALPPHRRGTHMAMTLSDETWQRWYGNR